MRRETAGKPLKYAGNGDFRRGTEARIINNLEMRMRRRRSALFLRSRGRTISSALETPIYYFFKDEDNASVVVTQSTRMVLGNKQEPSVVYELLTPDTRGEIEFCMMVIPPKAYSCRELKGHFGEEVAFFYSGEEVQLEIDGDSYTLHHEDSIRIPGGAMHRWYNPTDETVQVIFAVSPPSF